jgi:hypothetical protein
MASPVLVNGTTGVLATAIQVRGGDINVCAYHIFNGSNAAAFVQFFDGLAAPSVGTTVPKWVVAIPTLQQAFMDFPPAGLFFNGGLWVAATTTAGGSGAPSAALTVALAMS